MGFRALDEGSKIMKDDYEEGGEEEEEEGLLWRRRAKKKFGKEDEQTRSSFIPAPEMRAAPLRCVQGYSCADG